mmetsp:Transcript_1116/g.2988  ORF Transcript_1116/g.2988 Transcript_1116/m.2988 type:complete len:269 (-) Transcript_1116:91-897(-)
MIKALLAAAGLCEPAWRCCAWTISCHQRTGWPLASMGARSEMAISGPWITCKSPATTGRLGSTGCSERSELLRLSPASLMVVRRLLESAFCGTCARKTRPSAPPQLLAMYEERPGAISETSRELLAICTRTSGHWSSVRGSKPELRPDSPATRPSAGCKAAALMTAFTSSVLATSPGFSPREFLSSAQSGRRSVKNFATTACPARAATCSGVSSTVSLKALGSSKVNGAVAESTPRPAPARIACSSSRTTSGWPRCAAMCKAVHRRRT